MLDVSVPACRNLWYSTFGHGYAVGNHNAAVVGLVACAAYIHRYNIPVSEVLCVVRHQPYHERPFAASLPCGSGNELCYRLPRRVLLCFYISYEKRRYAVLACIIHIAYLENSASRTLECFVCSRWEFRKQPPLIGHLPSLVAVPCNCFKCRAK